jgi:hypothetical protein
MNDDYIPRGLEHLGQEGMLMTFSSYLQGNAGPTQVSPFLLCYPS